MDTTTDRPRRRVLSGDVRAASPVVGVLLMVALTIVVAAIASGGAFGIAERAGKAAPAVSFQAEWGTDGADDVLVLRHESGTALDPDYVTVSVDGTVLYVDGAPASAVSAVTTHDGWSGSAIESSEEIQFTEGADGISFEKGDPVRIYYEVDGQSYVVFGEN